MKWIPQICLECHEVYQFQVGADPPTPCPTCAGRAAMTKFIITWGQYKIVRLAISAMAWAVGNWRAWRRR